MSRSQFLLGVSAFLARLVGSARPAEAGGDFPDDRTLVRRIIPLPERAYFTYPHANGFLDARTCVVARPLDGQELEYLAVDLADGRVRSIGRLRNPRLYYAVGANGAMAVPMNDGVVVVDTRDGSSRRLATWPDWHVLGDCDISPDGGRVLVCRFNLANRSQSRVDMIEVATGEARTVFEADWPLDHAHFSPHDPSWVCFCDGSGHARHRMWVWHPQLAPQARSVFAQTRLDGSSFDIGHERAMFDRLASVVIAYGDSSAGPRGLYEVGFDGAIRLISESNRDCHCNVSVDGRWAVASTLGPAAFEHGRMSLEARAAADWTTSSTDFVPSDVTAVNMRTGARQLLFRGSNAVSDKRSRQPFEAQPAISPDGRWVIVKDARQHRTLAIEIDADALRRFLGSGSETRQRS